MNVLNRVTWNNLKKNKTRTIVTIIGVILSAAMMLRYSFDMAAEADCIEAAVNQVLNDGIRTADIWRPGCEKVGCAAMGDAILARL